MKNKKYLKKFLITTIGLTTPILILFCFLELFFRYSSLTPVLTENTMFIEDDILPYLMKPNETFEGRNATDEFNFHYELNSLGFRDYEHTNNYKKNKDTYRILGLGDSFMYGTGCSMDSSILGALEKKINTNIKCEIFKHGISRYHPDLYVKYIKSYGLKLKPDMIIVGLLPNDILDTYIGSDGISVNNSGYLISEKSRIFGETGVFLYINSHFFRYIITKISNILKPENNLLEISEISKTYDIELLLVAIPQAPPWNEETNYFFKRIQKLCKINKLKYLSTLETLKKVKNKESLYYKKDGHCKPKAYYEIANELYKRFFLSKDTLYN